MDEEQVSPGGALALPVQFDTDRLARPHALRIDRPRRATNVSKRHQ
jgi:hypothetical protein